MFLNKSDTLTIRILHSRPRCLDSGHYKHSTEGHCAEALPNIKMIWFLKSLFYSLIISFIYILPPISSLIFSTLVLPILFYFKTFSIQYFLSFFLFSKSSQILPSFLLTQLHVFLSLLNPNKSPFLLSSPFLFLSLSLLSATHLV